MMTSSDIFSGEVQYFRLEPKYWEPIVQALADAGLKGITTYVSWDVHMVEPPDAEHPAGQFDFTGERDPKLNLIGFLDLVRKYGLLLNFRCGPFCCNEQDFGGQPAEVVCHHPHMMVWDHEDKPTQGYWIARKEGMQPSYLHPEYLHLVSLWIAAVDEIIRPRLRSKGGFIDMINLDNEISYIVKDSFLGSDYNPVNVGRGGFWHQFLAEKYRDSDGLPYDTAYAAIEDVPPPRSVPEVIDRDIAWYLDWVEFKEWTMCKYLVTLREMHTKNGCGDVTFMTNFNPHNPEGIPTRMPSFEKAVQGSQQGIVGYDFYRGSFLSWSGYSTMARVLKLMNASLDYTWSAEFMSGIWEKTLSSRVSDDHMRFMARCALTHGCKSLAWFMFHDRRVWGDSPVSSHGHRRPSWEVLRNTRALAIEKIPHWDSLIPQADCAVLYDVTAHRHTAIGDPSPCNDSALHIGKPVIQGGQAGHASREYFGLFRVVEAGGAQANAIDIVARPGNLKQHKLVFLPGSPLISRDAVTPLMEWVDQGGTLVLSGTLPTLDDFGHVVHVFQGIKDEKKVGAGRILHCDWLGSEDAEKESLANIAQVSTWIESVVGHPQVRIQPVGTASWEDWNKGGGVDNAGTKASESVQNILKVTQPRVHASAVLQTGAGAPILFVLNHYPEATEFELSFGQLQPSAITCLDSGMRHEVTAGKVVVDIDRKSGAVYQVDLSGPSHRTRSSL